MRKLLTLLVLGLLFLAACEEQSHQQTASTRTGLSSKIDSLVNSYYEARQFSGSALVAENGNVLLQKEYGFTSVDSTKEINSESVFEIASISKQFTSLLIMILKEENELDYDDKIVRYFPDLPYDNITIRHLLTHTSELSERQFFMWAGQNMDQTKIYTNEVILDYLRQERPLLAFDPGEKWEYSNVGYFLLPLIMQQTTGKHYIQLLDEKIFNPLGMNNSGIYSQDFKGSEMDNYAFGKVFNPQDSGFMSSFGMAWSDSIYGGVGILSNATDLFKWDRALYSNKLIDQGALQEAFNPYSLANASWGWATSSRWSSASRSSSRKTKRLSSSARCARPSSTWTIS